MITNSSFSNNKQLSFAKILSQYLNFRNERCHMLQLKFFIKYLQPYTMKIFSSILSSLSLYMSLGAMFSLLFNEHPF